jgi:hypothetical protein
VEWTGVYQVPLLGAMIQTGLVLLCSLVAVRDRFLVRIMCSVLGMHVRQKDPLSRDKNTKLYICNHVTEFDHNLLNLLMLNKLTAQAFVLLLNNLNKDCTSELKVWTPE